MPAGFGGAAGRRRPRSVEHLWPHRGHRGGVRGPAGRRGAGADRSAAAGLGSGRRRRRRPAGGRRANGRAGDRRRRVGPLPRRGQGRREVRADADAGLAARLPQRRPGTAGQRGPDLLRPRRRPGQGRRSPHRAGRGGLGIGALAGRQRRGCRGSADDGGHAGAGRLRGQRRPRLRHGRRPGPARRAAAGRAGAAPGPARRAAHPHLRQGRPRRAALAAARRRRRGDRRARRHGGLAGRIVAGSARCGRRRARRPTSSRWAAARSPRRSWSPRCGSAIRRSPSPTCTTIRDSVHWRASSTSKRSRRTSSSGWCARRHD